VTSAVDLVADLLAAREGAIGTLRKAGVLDQASMEALVNEAARLASDQPSAANAVLGIVREAATTIEAPTLLPASDYVEARLVLEAGDPLRALTLIRSAEQGYRRLGLSDAALRTSLGQMHALDDLGRHAEAVQVGRTALAELDPAPIDPALIGLRAALIGNVGAALGYTGDHVGALAAYREAETLWVWLNADLEAAAAVANQGIELLGMAKWSDSLDRLTSAAATFERHEDLFWLAKCLGHRAEALTGAGRFIEALGDQQRARELLTSSHPGTELWRLAVESASTLLLLGLAEEALEQLSQVEAGLRSGGLQHDLGKALMLTGSASLDAGRPEAARRGLLESVEVLKAVGDTPLLARALITLAACVHGPDAHHYAATACDLVVGSDWPGIHCLALLALADHIDDEDRAQSLMRQAQGLADDLLIPHLQLACQQRRAARWLAEGNLDTAIVCYEEALALVESGSAGLRDATLHSAYVRSRRSAFTGLITALLARGSQQDLAHAADVIDRVKGRTILGVLDGWLQFGALPADSVRARMALNAGYSSLFVSNGTEYDGLRARVAAQERALALAEVQSATTTDRMARRAPVLGPSRDITAVSYYVLGDEILALVRHRGRTVLRRAVTDRRTVDDLLDELEGHVGGHAASLVKQFGHARLQACQRVLQNLYLALVAPLADLLPTSARPIPLAVSPHGTLHRVPFHALHDGRQYLLAQYAISISPNLALAERQPSAAKAGALLCVGVADQAAPDIEREAAAVASLAPETVMLLGDEATSVRVRDELSIAGSAHLAAHGQFRPGNPGFSSIRLADRWVRALDLVDLDLDGMLIVLSACETGRMEQAGGDEAVGLGATLLAAGCRCVIVSEWMADDHSTAALMRALHLNLASGASPFQALRSAQLDTMFDHPHPFYWAAFRAVGAQLE
jgi:CHAT domain-containing protein/tetratricopeptide (TPR) repeat protein